MEFLGLITLIVGCPLVVYGAYLILSVAFEGDGGWKKFVCGIFCLAIGFCMLMSIIGAAMEASFCPDCGQRMDTAYCTSCGALAEQEVTVPVVPICPGCGAECDTVYCGACGARVWRLRSRLLKGLFWESVDGVWMRESARG